MYQFGRYIREYFREYLKEVRLKPLFWFMNQNFHFDLQIHPINIQWLFTLLDTYKYYGMYLQKKPADILSFCISLITISSCSLINYCRRLLIDIAWHNGNMIEKILKITFFFSLYSIKSNPLIFPSLFRQPVIINYHPLW